METILLSSLNGLAGLFLLYLVVQFFALLRVRKRCDSVHKQPFQIKKSQRSWQDIVTIIAIIIMFGCWLIGIAFFEFNQVFVPYFAAILGMTSFPQLFRHGKVGRNGIASGVHFIPWDEIETGSFQWLKLADFHYPDGKLIINTNEGKSFELIIIKKYADEVTSVLKSESILTPV